MLLHPFPIHRLLCSVPPPPLPFPPRRVLSSDRTVNHTLSAGLILCVCVCVCAQARCACVCVCMCACLSRCTPSFSERLRICLSHLHFSPFFSSSPVLHLSHISHIFTHVSIKTNKQWERQLSVSQPQCVVDIDSDNAVSGLVYFYFGKCLAWLAVILFNSVDISTNSW